MLLEWVTWLWELSPSAKETRKPSPPSSQSYRLGHDLLCLMELNAESQGSCFS